MSGIAAVVKLRKAGYRKLAVYEKAEQVGGTWRANRYPGLSCDVPSHWYSFTFNPNPDWTHRFSYGRKFKPICRLPPTNLTSRPWCNSTLG